MVLVYKIIPALENLRERISSHPKFINETFLANGGLTVGQNDLL